MPTLTASNPVSGPDLVGMYDQIAPAYDHLHQRWLHFAGGEAQAALEAVVRVALKPDGTLLDAGCGTGLFARRLIADGVQPRQVSLADPSQAMLARCADLPVHRSLSRLENLPHKDAAFDIVTCAWALETVPRPREALLELCRVLRPGGMLCVTFCADKPLNGVLDWLMRLALKRRGTGRFLCTETIVRMLESLDLDDIKVLPTAGPAATLIAHRAPQPSIASL